MALAPQMIPNKALQAIKLHHAKLQIAPSAFEAEGNPNDATSTKDITAGTSETRRARADLPISLQRKLHMPRLISRGERR